MNVHTGPENLQRRWRPLAWLALVTIMLNPVLVLAQNTGNNSSVLKPGDSISLTVPGRSELDQDVVLDADGQVNIEPVGAIQVGGLSLSDATQLIKQKLRLYYTDLDLVQLESTSTASVRIYVIGAVNDKGVLKFDSPPSLWDVLRSIGGPLDSANLRAARIIREEDGQPQVHDVDLSGLMEGRDIPNFAMKDGDTLIIPTLVQGIPTVDSRSGVKVFGAVGVPTIVPIDEGTRLMDVLMLAGAPTEVAKKSEIYWVHNDGVRNQAQRIDLELFLMYGDEAGNPLVYPGDTINVEYVKRHWIWAFLAFAVSVATIYVVVDDIRND